jgi:predicted ATP-binding protein involved in virulence
VKINGDGKSSSLDAIERIIKQCSDATERIKCPENNWSSFKQSNESK